MDLTHKFWALGGFFNRQARFFWDIIILKIRIIGFANKRVDLFTRLGRLAYMSHPQSGGGAPDVEALIADIKETEAEIKKAESDIILVTEKARTDRSEFFNVPVEKE